MCTALCKKDQKCITFVRILTVKLYRRQKVNKNIISSHWKVVLMLSAAWMNSDGESQACVATNEYGVTYFCRDMWHDEMIVM